MLRWIRDLFRRGEDMNINANINVNNTFTMACKSCDECRGEVCLVPKLGLIVEQARPPAKTPQFQTVRPVYGDWIMNVSMTATQEVVLEIAAKDKKGNPAVLESGEWTTDNSDILSLEPDPSDFKKCKVSAFGPLGTAKVFFTGDGKVGPDVKTVIGESVFTISAGDATVLDITAGTPTEQEE